MFTQFPFQIYLLGEASPSVIMVQSGGTQLSPLATHPNLATTFLCCSFLQSWCHQISAEQEDQALSLLLSTSELPPGRENRREIPGGNNQQHFRGRDSPQRGGCSQYLHLCKRNGPALPAIEVEMTVPSCAGQQRRGLLQVRSYVAFPWSRVHQQGSYIEKRVLPAS